MKLDVSAINYGTFLLQIVILAINLPTRKKLIVSSQRAWFASEGRGFESRRSNIHLSFLRTACKSSCRIPRCKSFWKAKGLQLLIIIYCYKFSVQFCLQWPMSNCGHSIANTINNYDLKVLLLLRITIVYLQIITLTGLIHKNCKSSNNHSNRFDSLNVSYYLLINCAN